MHVAEVFGHDIADQSTQAWAHREQRHCRFRDSPCTKTSKTDPLGICTVARENRAAALCPVRFLENNRVFMDAARLAFGDGATFGIFPEIRILEIPSAKDAGKVAKIGKVDFLLGRIESNAVVDFAAVEIQAAYFSGGSLRPAFDQYMAQRNVDGIDTKRRPDFRSCAQKRLMPQLELKIPVFRRWGKKFFVVVDQEFFQSLPVFPTTSPGNSELTWLTYPIVKQAGAYTLADPEIVFSGWEDVKSSLREGRPPDPQEIVTELQTKLSGPTARRPTVLTC